MSTAERSVSYLSEQAQKTRYLSDLWERMSAAERKLEYFSEQAQKTRYLDNLWERMSTAERSVSYLSEQAQKTHYLSDLWERMSAAERKLEYSVKEIHKYTSNSNVRASEIGNMAAALNARIHSLREREKATVLTLNNLLETDLGQYESVSKAFSETINPFVSVIIPIYNARDWLSECLDSVVSQTLENIEIICVNDGSTDESAEILKSYQALDQRIVVINQENQGQGSARNKGIDIARGEYLAFLDADDFFFPQTLEKLYIISNINKLDVCVSKMLLFSQENGQFFETPDYSLIAVKDFFATVSGPHDIGPSIFRIATSVCAKLFRRVFVESNKILFPEGILLEDNRFTFQALLSSSRVYFLDEFSLCRRVLPRSTMFGSDKDFRDAITVSEQLEELLARSGFLADYKSESLNYLIKLHRDFYYRTSEENRECYFDSLKQEYSINAKNGVFFDDNRKHMSAENLDFYDTVAASDNYTEFVSLL
jgi:glycosyltransferase involved in cell wall biosynthesis